MAVCSRCGTPAADGARFCASCGAALPREASASGHERKLATMLFADVTGSARLAERLDPEEVGEVMGVFFEAMRGEIEREGGTVEKFVGDAVLAVFGVPAAREDDPARAVRAALAMQRRIEDVNARLAARRVELQVRIGVHTGDVLAVTAPRPGEALVSGDAVNVAARLQQAAEPGRVVVSERTARAARGFRYRPLGALELRGKHELVPAAVVEGEADEPTRGVPGLQAPMVGRDRELGLLRTLFERAAAERRPHLVTVYGEPGVGKTRLVDEFLAEAEAAERPIVLRGRCLSYGKGVYRPLAEILKREAGVHDTDSPEAALAGIRRLGAHVLAPAGVPEPARATAALAYTIGVEDPDVGLRGLSPRQVRAEIHAAWRAFFSSRAANGALVVVVEDVHWAEPALLELLEQVVERAEGAILVVCTARPELAQRAPAWGGGRGNASSLVLEPLSAADADRLIGLLLSVAELPRTLRDRILARSEGNPFFLEEVLRRLIDEGVIVRSEGKWRCVGPAEHVAIPDTVKAVVAARIDLLETSDKRTLQHAAVVGRVFWPGPLARLAGEDADRIAAALDRLEARDLVRSRLSSSMAGETEYVFKHALIRDVAYESLPRRERPAAHEAVAGWIEEATGGGRLEFAGLLAHHYEDAYRGSPDAGPERERRRARAYTYLLRASEDARSKLALAEAQHLAGRAVELAASPRERSDALEAMGEAFLANYQGDDAWRAFRDAVDARLEESPPDARAVSYLCGRAVDLPTRWPGTMHELPTRGEVRRYLQVGFEHLPDGESKERVRLLTARAFEPFAFFYEAADYDLDEARRAGKDAAEMALRLGDRALASAALDAVASVEMTEGRYAAMEEVERQRVALVPDLADANELGDIYAGAAWASFHVGRYREAADHARRGFELALADAPAVAGHCLALLVVGLHRLGDWQAALEADERLEALLGERWRDPPRPFLRAAAATAFMREARGEREEADRQLGVLASITDVQQARSVTGPSWVALTLARRGCFVEAREWLARLRAPEGLGLRLEAACDLVAEEGSWDDAASTVAQAREHASWAGLLALPCYADRLEGRALLAAGEVERAVAALEAAAEGFDRLGARWERACTELSLGEALAAAGRRADARAALERAAREFTATSSRRELERAQALLTSR